MYLLQVFFVVLLRWRPRESVPQALFSFSSQDECYNYIKVLVPRNDETLFACGTNAFNPTCRNYKVRQQRACVLPPGFNYP